MTDEVVVNEKGELVALNGKDAVSMMRVAMSDSCVETSLLQSRTSSPRDSISAIVARLNAA